MLKAMKYNLSLNLPKRERDLALVLPLQWYHISAQFACSLSFYSTPHSIRLPHLHILWCRDKQLPGLPPSRSARDVLTSPSDVERVFEAVDGAIDCVVGSDILYNPRLYDALFATIVAIR